MAADLVRVSILAGRNLEALELGKIPPFPGAERGGVMRTRKSRIASVSEQYVGPAPRPGIFDRYRGVFEAAGWRPCGHSITLDNYCRGEYEAIVAVPSALGSGSYSVTLKWNRITWPVRLTAGALIWIACLSAAVWTKRGAPRPHAGGAERCGFVPRCPPPSARDVWRPPGGATSLFAPEGRSTTRRH